MASALMILAFGFTSPLWLWGLGSVAVPIAIHLWRRQTPRVLPWGPMKFLRDVMNRHARRLRVESLLILLVRCLLLVVLALAVARPFVESDSPLDSGTLRRHKVLLVDGTLSMTAKSGQESRMDLARELAREIVLDSGAADTFNLCRIGDSTSPVIIRRPAHDREDVLREIERLPLMDDAGDLATTLRQVLSLLSEVPPHEAIDLFVISDFQSSQWVLETPAEEVAIRQMFQSLSERSRLFLLNASGERVTNLSLSALQVPQQVILSGRPFHVEVTVFNHTSEEQSVPVEILADRIVRYSQQVTVPAASAQKITATLRIPEVAQEVLLEARLPFDAIMADNKIQRVVVGRKTLEALLVDGRPGDRLSESASGFLKLAIDPTAASVEGGPLVPTVCTIAEMPTQDFSRFDVIVLCDVAGLNSPEIIRIEEFVKNGGGLVLGWGEQCVSERFADSWGSLIPIEVREIVDSREEPVTFDPGQLEHPVLELFRGRSDSGLATSPVSRFARLAFKPDAHWQPILNYSTGDPAILERTMGRGQIVLISTSLDDSWGNWVLWPSYVPLMNRLLQHAMSGHLRSEPVQVGQPLVVDFAQSVTGTWTLPDAKIVEALTETRGNSAPTTETILSWPETGTAGFYQLSVSTPLNIRRSFAVNPDPRESDPRTVTEEILKRGMLSGIDFQWGLNEASTPSGPLVASADQGSYSRPLIGFALGLLFVEMLLAWKFRWGVAALVLVIACACVSISGVG